MKSPGERETTSTTRSQSDVCRVRWDALGGQERPCSSPSPTNEWAVHHRSTGVTSALLNKPTLAHLFHGLLAAMHAEPLPHVLQMLPHGVGGDVQQPGNLDGC